MDSVSKLLPVDIKQELSSVGVEDRDIEQLWRDFVEYRDGKPAFGKRGLIPSFLDLRGSRFNRALFARTIRILVQKVPAATETQLRAAS